MSWLGASKRLETGMQGGWEASVERSRPETSVRTPSIRSSILDETITTNRTARYRAFSEAGTFPDLTLTQDDDAYGAGPAVAAMPFGRADAEELDQEFNYYDEGDGCHAAGDDAGDDAGDGGQMNPFVLKVLSDRVESSNIAIVSIVWVPSGHLGVAVLDTRSTALEVLTEQFLEYGCLANFSTLEKIVKQWQPEIVLVPAGIDEDILQALNELKTPYIYKETGSAFGLERSLKRISVVQVASQIHGRADSNPLCSAAMYAGINIKQKYLCRALGGLLNFVDRWSAGTILSKSEKTAVDPGPISDLRPLFVDGLMSVDSDTRSALGIFEKEIHPSKMGLGGAKEGLSAYGIFQSYCVTPSGKRLMRSWLMHPLTDASIIASRHNAIDIFVDMKENASLLQQTMSKCHDLTNVVKNLGAVGVDNAETSGWIKLVQGLAASLNVKTLLSTILAQGEIDPSHNKIIEGWCSSIDEVTINRMLQMITQVVDLDQSQALESSCTMVASGIMPELDELKALHQSLPGILFRSVEAEFKRIPSSLVSPTLINTSMWRMSYIPQFGYLLLTDVMLTDGILEVLPDFHFQFQDHHTIYYSTSETRRLSAEFGDVYARILDAESAVLTKLKLATQREMPCLRGCLSTIAELDCLISFASVARDYSYVRPDIVADKATSDFIAIRNGRHMLQEIQMQTRKGGDRHSAFIPNDTNLGNARDTTAKGHYPRINVVTGPNMSGKSIYAKQVGLFSYLAQVGSYLPADEAVLGISDAIFTRIVSSEQRIRERLSSSSFMSDLAQVHRLCRFATSRSIVILDEFGKGTLASDGAALLCATITYFLKTAPQPPKVIVVTHFSELFSANLVPKSEEIDFFSMEASICPEKKGSHTFEGGKKRLTFLFKLKKCSANIFPDSYGLVCGIHSGLPSSLIDRAGDVVTSLRSGHLGTRTVTIEPRSDGLIGDLKKWSRAACQALLAASSDLADIDPHTIFAKNSKQWRF